jgi:predicted DNA-binding transcriptional regulator AlpA
MFENANAHPRTCNLSGRARIHRARPLPDLSTLPSQACITRRQLGELTGFSQPTLKAWVKQGKGPRVTYVEGRPRYLAGDVREWLAQSAQSA